MGAEIERKPRVKRRAGRWTPHECAICGEIGQSRRIDGVWYCGKHYQRMCAHGGAGVYYGSTIEVRTNIAIITTRKGETFTIDAEDAELCSKYNWHMQKGGYASTFLRGEGRLCLLHRLLMLDGEVSKKRIDHINGDTTDNRRCNLRVTDAVGNARNCQRRRKSMYGTGVVKSGNGYRARLGVGGKQRYFGTYGTVEEARRARRRAEIEVYGEFAPAVCRECAEGEFEAWQPKST